MADIAHKQTDKLISELDEKLKMVYALANREMQEKADDYFKKFEAKDKIKQAQVASGKITDKEYKEWRKGQILIGDKWKEMRETLASDMTNTNEIAVDIINGHRPTAYALNHNYSTFQVEKDSLTDTSFTLYSHESVEKLIKDNPDILPKWKIDKAKDYQWNYKKVNSITTQAILQGESIPEISKKLASGLCTQNNNLMNTFARTAITGAQNSGRMDAYHRAKDMGISMKKVWLATLDGRTRHSHRMLDGQKVDIDEMFDNKCLFPGDPSGPASEVYNCRCTLLSQPTGVDYKVSDLTKRNEKLGSMSYEAWQNFHSFGLSNGIMPDVNITNVWLGKKYGHVYNLMKYSTMPGHGADANNFFYALKEIGQETGIGNPPQVWASYLAGDLDDDQIAKFEGILMKYLPDSTVDKIEDIADALSHDDFLKSIKDISIWSDQVPSEAFGYMHQKVGNDSLAKFWDDYKAGKISDSKLDELLGYKEVVETTDKIDNPFASKTWMEMIDESDLLKPGQPAMTYLLDDYDTGWSKHLEDWANGKVKDSKLDDLLLKKADKIDDISDAAKEAEAALKIPKGNPMTKEQADNYKVNVFYDKSEATLTNCQTTTFAYECRCQGYDVVAIPKDKSLKEVFDLTDDLADDESKAWINKITGKPPKHELEWWNAGKDSPTNAEMIKAIDDAVGHNGERYAISLVNNSGKSAHIINIDRDENGFLRIVDNQRGPLEKNTWVGNFDVENYLQNFKTINYLVRQDDCVPNPEYFNKILTSAAKAKPDLPATASAFSDYTKLNKFVKDNNLGKTSEYYKKWKYGLIDNDDLDNLLKSTKTESKLNNKIDSILAIKTYTEALDSLDDDIAKEVKEIIEEIAEANGVTYAEYWSDYAKGKLIDPDLDKLLKDVKVYDNKISDALKKYKDVGIWDNDFDEAVLNVIQDTVFKPGQSYDEYEKAVEEYWEKYKLGKIKDADIDKLLGIGQKGSDLANKADEISKASKTLPDVNKAQNGLDMDLIKDKSASKVWKELNEAKAGGGKFWSDITEIGKQQGIKPAEVWKKYLAGELDTDDIAKIETHLAKLYAKTDKVDDLADWEKKIAPWKDVDIWGSDINPKQFKIIKDGAVKAGITEDEYWKKYVAGKIKNKDLDDILNLEIKKPDIKKTLPKNFLDMDDIMVHDVIEMITPKAPGIKGPSQYYKKWLNNEIVDIDLDNYFKVPTITPKPATSETINVLEAVKNKKVSTIWNQLKDEGGTTYSQWWKIVGDIGKSYDKKQSATWDLYLEGKLKDDEKEKIENFLLKHYLKKSDDVIDYSEFGGKEVYDTLKKYDSVDNFLFDAPAAEYDKIVKLFHDNADEVQTAIDKIKKLEKAKTTAKTVETKSDDLIKAEKKLNDLQSKLQKYEWYNNKIDVQGEVLEFTKDGKKIYAYSIDKGNDLLKQGAVPSNKFTEDFAKSLKGVKQDDLLNDIDDVKKKIVDLSSNKSDELVKAEEKLNKAEDALKAATKELKDKVDNKETWVGLWKEPVTLDDYAEKKDKIAAKKIYFETEIDKLTNDPDYKSWLSDDAKDWQINNCKKNLKVLADYEKAGKKAEKYYDAVAEAQEAVAKAQQEVVKNTPVGEAFSQARKDAAVWGKNKTNDYERVDKIFDPHAREVHATRTAKETAAYIDYTSASGPYNKPLVGFDSPDGTGSDGWTMKYWVGPGKVDIDKRGRGDKIRALTTLIEKSTYDFDFWMQSSQNFATLEGKEGFLGIPYGTLQNMKESEFQKFIGTTAELPQFISGAVNKGGGRYNPGSMRLNIYVPKGSEALYVLEDGTFEKHEHEMILQRGGTYRITNMYWGYDDLNKERCLFVDMELHPEMGYDKFQQTKSK